ncbi:MAG: hypothetical protein R2873_34965 [Caldilineaceae bacterium]|nr:hypothetical protein [Caldilineaceae bacterium]
MHLDAQRTIDVVTAALLRELGDEVDLIFRYGSLLSGAAHKYSDLDISYVPTHDTTHSSITVLVDDVLVDLYPIRWSWLTQMADFATVNATILLQGEVIYQRNEDVGLRFHALGDRLRELQQPEARPEMVTKALDIFKQTGYPALLLREQAAADNTMACLFHAQRIVHAVMHAVMVCNQTLVDTRKPDRLLALPRLPEDFATNLERVTAAVEPDDLAAACEDLLLSTRRFLLAEQADVARSARRFADVFGPAYPELKGDLLHVLLACERKDMFSLKDKLLSLYHELSIHTAWASTGIDYGDFNSLADYEQNFVALGFPALLPHVMTQDFDGLHRQMLLFDARMQSFLKENGVDLYSFADLDALEKHLVQKQK